MRNAAARAEIAFVPFVPEHLARLSLGPIQAEIQSFLAGVNADALVGPYTWTAFAAAVASPVEVIGCGGIMPLWPGVGQAWALIGRVPRRCWPAATAFVRATLHTAMEVGGLHRIQASVRTGFAPGARWAERLGMDFEGTARAYDPARVDHDLYAMVRAQ